MKSPLFKLKEQNLLKIILRSARKKKVKLYLVGGFLRDILLEREKEHLDIDFSIKNHAIDFGRYLAKNIKAGFVVLDKKHGCCRLVKKVKAKIYTLDFTDFRGPKIQSDLLRRDFTINALAIDLESIFKVKNLDSLFIDPYGARGDLKARLVRVVNKKGFDEDPLRILRAFSMSSQFDFNIDKETLRLIKLKKDKLCTVSSERIRDELFKILDSPNSFDYLVQMDKLKILKIIFPEIEMMRGLKQGPYHHLDVLNHTLETVRQLENILTQLKNDTRIQDYLDEVISSRRRRRSLIKLGALLHDMGKPQAVRRENGKIKFHGHEKISLQISEDIVKRLRLSNDELDALKRVVLWHLRPGYLADNEKVTPRATFRYFRDTGPEAVSTLLISLADQRATRGPLTSKASRRHHERVVFSLIKEYFKRKQEKKLRRLISGRDLIKKFKLEPSPLIGKILSEVEELQAIGRIKSKEQALQVAKKFIK